MKKTVMIFGVSSFIGSNLIESLKDEFRIIGTYYKTPVTIPGVTSLPCDVLRKEYVSSLVALFRPNVIIYAVGLHSLSASEKNPKICEALNTTGAINCATSSDRFSSKFIYFSSGFIFSGENQEIRESETPFPNTTYGKTLSSTEFYIQTSCLNYAILRCSTLYGRAYPRTSVNWFEKLQLSLMNGQPTLIDDNVYTGFLDTQTVGNAVKMIIRENISNRLLNLSSKDHLTRFQFAKIYARVFKKDVSLLQPTMGNFPGLSEEGQEEKKELFFKLDCTSFEELTGLELPNVDQSLHLTLRNWKQLTR